MATKRELEKAKSYEKKAKEYMDKACKTIQEHKIKSSNMSLKEANALWDKKFDKRFKGYKKKATEMYQLAWNWKYNNGKPIGK